MTDATDLLRQTIVSDKIYQIWECQQITSRPKTGIGTVRYVGTAGPQCKSCGGPKHFDVGFSVTEQFGMDDILAKITAQIDGEPHE